ncbi:hypothetical protein D3C79_946610 [compost metagenome]
MRHDIWPQLRQRLATADHRRIAAKQLLVDLGQQVRVVIRLAPQHHPIEGFKMGLAFC